MKEKENKKRKRTKILIIISYVVLFAIIIGLSYAWLYTVIYGEKDMNIVVGDIELVLNETNEGIQLVNTIPTYDDEGKAGEPYTFTLKNNSAIPLYYTLGVVDDEEAISACETDSGGSCELLDSRDVRYELKMGDRTFTGTLSDSYIMSYGIINADEEVDCELRIWLNINANNEAIGKVFLGKLKVFASQQVADADFEQGTDNVNAPVMDDNMIAVKHDGYNWVKTDTDNNWYNYDMGIWANAVTVKSDKLAEYQSAAVGTTINMDDIETMWVWIPRYSYTIGSENGGASYYGKKGIYLDSTPTAAQPGEIDIKFIDTNTKDTGNAKYLATETPKNYRTPDAFTYDGKELPGIWVGKFETSSSNPNASYGGSNNTSLDPMIKPNVTSWRNINVSNIHTVATKVSAAGNRYGFSESMNSHAMKNSEWGVVAYLSQSRYGKLGNENFTGANKEVYQNKSDQFITGCSYGSPSNGNTDYGCQYRYDNNVRDETGFIGKGVGASTTGTIYGVYDMSGGAWEYVMGNYNDTIGSSGFSAMPDAKYYDKYTSDNARLACNGEECLSHGLSETAGWYSDVQNMISAEYPWFGRGGYYDYAAFAGVFYFGCSSAGGSIGASFCLVMSATSP